jgi:hypothetical protein
MFQNFQTARNNNPVSELFASEKWSNGLTVYLSDHQTIFICVYLC